MCDLRGVMGLRLDTKPHDLTCRTFMGCAPQRRFWRALARPHSAADSMNIFQSLPRFALPLMLVSTGAWADNITLYRSYSIEVGPNDSRCAAVPQQGQLHGQLLPRRQRGVGHRQRDGRYSSPTRVSPGVFTLRLNGSNFVTGVAVKFGDVEWVTMVSSATSLTATGMATAEQLRNNVALTVRQIGAGATTDLAAGRLLEQAACGPNPAALARVKLIDTKAWLTEQFSIPETAISDPVNDKCIAQSQLLNRQAKAPDELRQQVAYALSEIIVISMNKNNDAEQTAPYLQTLSRNAFGNYRTLIGEISIGSQMGKYLDLANSNKPGSSGDANENFPRELMQLFTLGLVKLILDGSNPLNAIGQTLPVYQQTTVQQSALAMTGWTYIGNGNNNWENFAGPMVPRDVNHDMRAKCFLGCNLPAGQGVRADLKAAWSFSRTGQTPLSPPSVFIHYSPMFRA